MASFLSILKAAGKDLSHVGSWIEDGLKIAEPVLAAVDPPVAGIVAAVEAAVEQLEVKSQTKLTAAQIQAITTSVATLEGVKASITPATS